MSRKRDKPYVSRHERAPLPKRRRPLHPRPPPPLGADEDGDKTASKPRPPPAVVVMGLSPDCSVLDLKSRFEIYGAISRIRIDREGVGSITFRSKDSAEAAIAASLDSSFGITIDSKRVKVLWATDPLAQWGKGIGIVSTSKDNTSSSSSTSKLLRAGVPLSRHGRSNKLASAIVNPRSSSNGGGGGDGGVEERMIRSSVVVKGNKGVARTLAAIGKVRLGAIVNSSIFSSGTSMEASTLSLSLPREARFFIVDYNVPEQDVWFQFMNTVKVLDKWLKWTMRTRGMKNGWLWMELLFLIQPMRFLLAINWGQGIAS